MPQVARIFLTVGTCGGDTTSRPFLLDAWFLIERGQLIASFGYMRGSVELSASALAGALLLLQTLG